MVPRIIISILAAGILFMAALLAYVCGLVGRRQHLNPWFPRGLQNSSEQQQPPALHRGNKKALFEVDEEPGHDQDSGVVKKTVFSSKMRMVVPVGLEGTGHHFVVPLLKSVCKLETVVCPNVCAMIVAMYNHMGSPERPSDYKTGLALLQGEMKTLAATADSLDNGATCFAGFGGCEHGMMSYPMLSGPDKPLQHVDLKILAREAERAGIDLRLLYLRRPARDILISDTQHRHFGGTFTHEARILIVNAAVIWSIFREVDPEFVTCMSYDKIGTDPAQAARIAEIVVPAPGVAAIISETIRNTHHNTSTKDPVVVDDQEGWDLMANRLQEKLDAIERDLC